MSSGPKPRGGLAEASPRTRALEVLIQASLDQLLDDTPAKANEGLLFLGNWHDALPRLLIQDPILQPVDKVVWQVIKLQATAQGATGFPTYDQIARWANVASDATVARAIAILRSTRWLTLCVQKARTRKGRFRGNVYALHDEPLALGDTLHLDPEYMQFLCRLAAKPGEGRVGEVAKAVLGSIELDIQEGIDVTAPRDAMTERMEAMRFITAAPGQAGQPAQRVFGVRRGFAMTLQSRVKDGVQPEVPDSEDEAEGQNLDLFATEVHLQNLKMDENVHLQKMKMGNRLQKMKVVPQPQNLNPQNLGSPPSLGSSGSKNITTTTTYLDGLDNKSARAREEPSLENGCIGPIQLDPRADEGRLDPNHFALGAALTPSTPPESMGSLVQLAGNGCMESTQAPEDGCIGPIQRAEGRLGPKQPMGANGSQGDQPDVALGVAQSANCLAPKHREGPEPPPGGPLHPDPGAPDSTEVQYPAELSSNEIVLARFQLAKVPADLRQEVLDLLGDRIRAAAAGTMEPLIFGPMGYLRTLCQRAVDGTLIRRTRVVQRFMPPAAAPSPALPPAPPDEDAVQLKKLRDEHFNALGWKQKLERIGPGRDPTAEQLQAHRTRVEDAVRQIERLSQQIQDLLNQRPDLRPQGIPGDRPPATPGAGVRQ